MAIDKDKLKEIDSNIDEVVKSFDLLKVSRDLALNAFLCYYEEYMSSIATAATRDIIGHNILGKQAQDGIDFAIQWIFKYCPLKSKKNPNERMLKRQAKNLLEQAQEYSRVWDFMNLLYRDMCKAKDVHFTHADYDASFAGYKFIGKGIGMHMIRQFNQNTDFDFEGL